MQLKSKEKKERSLGVHLHLKAERCNSPKCVMLRRPYPPGQNGRKKKRRGGSEFGVQLKEKQKLKWSYGLKENKIQNIFREAGRSPLATGEKMIELLERRLDNVVYRLGLALSRSVARGIIKDGHVMVNGRKMTIASYEVKIGDVMSIRPESKGSGVFKKLEEHLKSYDAPTWLQLDKTTREGKMVALPFDTKVAFDIDLVIEYLSRYE